MTKFSENYYMFKSIFISLIITGCKKFEFIKYKSLMIDMLSNPEIAALKRMKEYKELESWFKTHKVKSY